MHIILKRSLDDYTVWHNRFLFDISPAKFFLAWPMITPTNNTVFELSSLWLEVTFAGELVNFHLVGVGEKLGSGTGGTWFPGQDQSRCEKQSEASEWVINVILTLQTDCLWGLFFSVPHHPSRGKDAKRRNKEKTWQMYSWTRWINEMSKV